MLTKTGAKLLDFGLAKLQQPAIEAHALTTRPLGVTATATGTIMGTLPYMAPEQIEGKDVDARGDIFSLGALLFEMATGRRAFDGQSQASLIAAILERDTPPPSSHQPDLPPAFDHVVRRCLAKDPDERWQSTRDVMIELRWIAETAPAVDTARSGRWNVRERVAWAVATLALLAAAGAAAWTGWGGSRPAPSTTRSSMRLTLGLPASAPMAIED